MRPLSLAFLCCLTGMLFCCCLCKKAVECPMESSMLAVESAPETRLQAVTVKARVVATGQVLDSARLTAYQTTTSTAFFQLKGGGIRFYATADTALVLEFDDGGRFTITEVAFQKGDECSKCGSIPGDRVIRYRLDGIQKQGMIIISR